MKLRLKCLKRQCCYKISDKLQTAIHGIKKKRLNGDNRIRILSNYVKQLSL